VAKRPFHESQALPVLRRESKNPLFVTAAGIEASEAAEHVRVMHGEHRIPTLLKRADALARGLVMPEASGH
jgi:deoxyribonuclease V